MRVRLAVLALLAATVGASAGQRVNLAPGARVCDATDCRVLSSEGLSVEVWQTIPGVGIQFLWKGQMLTAQAASIDEDVQVCDWGPYEGRRTYLCDGYPARERAAEAPRPKRRTAMGPAVTAELKRIGRYAEFYPAD